MTTPGFGRAASRSLPTIPRGEVVAVYDTYQQAQQAVDVLAKADFPVQRVAIIGNELKSVERVTGKLSYGRAAGAGALSGVYLGLFFGILLLLFSPATTTFAFLAAALLIGAGFGMLFGLVSYAIGRRRRDFTSVMQVVATSYGLLVEPDSAHRVRNILGGEVPQAAPMPPPAPPASAAPSPVSPGSIAPVPPVAPTPAPPTPAPGDDTAPPPAADPESPAGDRRPEQ